MMDPLDKYREAAGAEVINELQQFAAALKGVKIVHVNSTKYGGGVAEILNVMTLLTKSLGIDANWETIKGNQQFFNTTKAFHNGLQGQVNVIPPLNALNAYENVNAENAEELRPILESADVVFIHDPQPAALIKSFPNRKNKWIWRCHIDLSSPQRALWRYLRNFITHFDASIFSLPDFVQPLPHPLYLIPPSIDPLSEKNIDLTPEEISSVYQRFDLDPHRPLILQVSRFDHFKDPIGVIKAYKLAKKFKHGIQLVLAGGSASDDPEGEAMLQHVNEASEGDPDIHILNLPPDAHHTINALQRTADIILQKSTKEGFGLTVTEALWKRKPVIGGNTGGIRLQVIDHHTGFLVNTPEGAALRIRYLLQNPHMIHELGERGHKFVHDNFLITRHLRDYLTVAIALLYPDGNRLELQKISPLA
jgi:trehalose synthase